jgi:hypothetical protein
MTRFTRTPTERELAELALAAEVAGDEIAERVTIEDVLTVLDDPAAAPQQRELVLRALSRNPDLYLSWLAGRRPSEDTDQAMLPLTAAASGQDIPGTPTVSSARRESGWLRGLFDWPWQTAAATVTMLLIGFTAGHLIAPPRTLEGRLPIGLPDVDSKGPGRSPASTNGERSSNFDLGVRAGALLQATFDACATAQGSLSDDNWSTRAGELAALANEISTRGAPLTAPAAAVVNLASRVDAAVPSPGESAEQVIRRTLCEQESLYAIQQSLGQPIG